MTSGSGAAAQDLDCMDRFDAKEIIAEYDSISVRTQENQRRLSDILRREPTTENFSDVYSIVQRLLEAERSDENFSTAGRPDNPYIRKMLQQVPKGSKGLEIGCAQGRLTEYLVSRGYAMVGLDSSRDAIAVAKARAEGTDWGKLCTFFAADARDLKDFKSEYFDFAISTEVVEHLGLPGFMLHMDQMRRVLKTGGKYFVTCPSALISGTEGDLHIRMYYFREMCQIARMMGFEARQVVNVKNRLVFTIPAIFNPLVRLYESTLRVTRLNLLFNKLGITVLCLPMIVTLVKKKGLNDERDRRHRLRDKGYYHD